MKIKIKNKSRHYSSHLSIDHGNGELFDRRFIRVWLSLAHLKHIVLISQKLGETSPALAHACAQTVTKQARRKREKDNTERKREIEREGKRESGSGRYSKKQNRTKIEGRAARGAPSIRNPELPERQYSPHFLKVHARSGRRATISQAHPLAYEKNALPRQCLGRCNPTKPTNRGVQGFARQFVQS